MDVPVRSVPLSACRHRSTQPPLNEPASLVDSRDEKTRTEVDYLIYSVVRSRRRAGL